MSSVSEQSAETTAMPSISGGAEIRSAYDWVSDTARENPALVVGGAVAVGAIAALVLLNRKPQSRARALERRIGRELSSMEKALKRNRPISSMADHLADASAAVSSRLGSWNMDALEGLIRRAGDISAEIVRRRGWH
ncbi:MAG TPA: hypothetical protein VNZ50_04750 [Hyphomicrobiaceae bacterium]|nr:hypothetical protein [Hyphomicrobiaceae bacterium]